MAKALVIGGATIDVIVPCTSRLDQVRSKKWDVAKIELEAGGGAVNTATVLSRLGRCVTIHCAIGDDAEGQYIREKLAAEGIDLSHVEILAGLRTGRAVIDVHDDGDVSVIAERGANLAFSGMLIKGFAACEMVYITSAPTAVYGVLNDVFTNSVASHPKIAFNPGIRQINEGGSEFEKLLKRTDLLIVNVLEAEQLLARLEGREIRSSPIELCRDLAAFGPRTVCVTSGASGAWLVSGHADYFQPAQPSKVVSSIGAGDAFGATFAHFNFGGWPLERAAALAATNAAAAVSRAGARTGVLSASRLLKNALPGAAWL